MEYHKIQTVFKRDPDTNHKTLIENDFSLPEFGYLADNEWVFTEKVDGTNIRVYYENGNIEFGGRTDKAEIPTFLMDVLVYEFYNQYGTFKEMFGDSSVCLYGEGYGPKIQKGGKYLDRNDFVLFDVQIDGWWLKREAIENIAENLHINAVPIIGRGTLWDMVDYAKQGIVSSWGDFQAEGIVARPSVELQSRNGNRVITKVKCKDFPSIGEQTK